MKLPRDIYDKAAGDGTVVKLEVTGEKFLRCANINSQAKLLAGFFYELSKEKKRTSVKYCDKFISRDILACFENFRAGALKISSYSFDASRFEKISGVRTEVPHYVEDFLNCSISGEVYPSLLKNLADNLRAGGEKKPAGYKKEVLIAGSAYPLYSDIWKYFSDNQVYIRYVEFCDICMRSAKKKDFSPASFFNMGLRAARINRLADTATKEGRDVKILHVFPKFSHYEIEDSFFSKNIKFDYLSLDYAGGGQLNERDKIRLETFIKM